MNDISSMLIVALICMGIGFWMGVDSRSGNIKWDDETLELTYKNGYLTGASKGWNEKEFEADSLKFKINHILINEPK